MLDFWILQQGEEAAVEGEGLADTPPRAPDFSIGIQAYHRIADLGLRATADKVGLSFFSDAVIEVDESGELASALLAINEKYNSGGAKTECLEMASVFASAFKTGRKVVICSD